MTAVRKLVLAASLLSLSVGCEDTTPVPDGGADGGVLGRQLAAAPSLLPCPSGWTEVDRHGVTVCDPTGGLTLTACGPGEAWLPGASGCAPIGRACPSGRFAEDLPASGVRYVEPGGTGGGSIDAPFGTITEALSDAPAGTTIALARGLYEENVLFRTGVHIRGACASETILAPTTREASVVRVNSTVTGAALSDVTVGRSDNLGFQLFGELHVEGVVVEDTWLIAVGVFGGRLSADGFVVRDGRPGDSGEEGGGVLVLDGGVFIASRTVVTRNRKFGVTVGEGCRAELRDSAIRSQRPGAPPTVATNLLADGAAVVVGERLELTDAVGANIILNGGATLELSDAAVRHTRTPGEENGMGLSSLGSTAHLTRVWLDDHQGAAVVALEGGALQLEDVLVSDTVLSDRRDGWAAGISTAVGNQSELVRVRVGGVAAAGISVIGTTGAPRGETRIAGADVSVLDVEDRGASGVGLYLYGSVEADLERVHVERSTGSALIVGGDSHLRLRHAHVLDTRAHADGLFGRGLEVVGGSDATIEHARFERQREVALIFASGTSTLTDVEIVDTVERDCAATTCAAEPGGIGMGAYGEAHVSVERFLIAGAPLCGVQVAVFGELDLRSGSIDRAAVGACVQVPGYDLERLTDDVAYLDTDTPIQATSHYVPTPQDPLTP